METFVHDDKRTASEAAAERAAGILIETIRCEGEATFVAATGASQFDFIDALTSTPGVDWSKTAMYHLDEYVGLPPDHRASFRKYLRERFTDAVSPGTVYWIRGDASDPRSECERLNGLLAEETVDVAFVGIGENGHIAFNDPPADFEITDPFIVVDLDEDCRRQQVGEGWFEDLSDVPRRAISMSVQQIMASRHVVCTIPGERKARAVTECLGSAAVSPMAPASILQDHPRAFVYLDQDSASLL